MINDTIRQLVFLGKYHPHIIDEQSDNSFVSGHFSGSMLRKNDHLVGGILLTDRLGCVQAIEGPADIVEILVTRIRSALPHYTTSLLSDRGLAAREFGAWQMTLRNDDGADHEDALGDLLASVSDDAIHRAFLAFHAGTAVEFPIDSRLAKVVNR
jgi:hypothetical protein